MKTIAIIGFGSQAKSWALNLKDSGYDVHIGLRQESSSINLAKELNFKVYDLEKDHVNFTEFIILTPDDTHYEIVTKIYQTNPKVTFIYAHGFSIENTAIKKETPLASHLLLAPKAIASELRFEYETKGKLAAVYSYEYNQNESNTSLLESIAKGIGITCLRKSNFQEETNADLFSEQSILCSILPYCALYSYNTLRNNGISKEIAFFECWHEVKLIANTLISMGPEKFFELISPNALMGAEYAKEILLDEKFKQKLQDIYKNIETKNFNKSLNSEQINKVRKETLSFWKAQELNDTYNELKKDLYSA